MLKVMCANVDQQHLGWVILDLDAIRGFSESDELKSTVWRRPPSCFTIWRSPRRPGRVVRMGAFRGATCKEDTRREMPRIKS